MNRTAIYTGPQARVMQVRAYPAEYLVTTKTSRVGTQTKAWISASLIINAAVYNEKSHVMIKTSNGKLCDFYFIARAHMVQVPGF